MVTLKYLVIGITNHFKIIINKSFMNGNRDRGNLYLGFQISKNNMQPF